MSNFKKATYFKQNISYRFIFLMEKNTLIKLLLLICLAVLNALISIKKLPLINLSKRKYMYAPSCIYISASSDKNPIFKKSIDTPKHCGKKEKENNNITQKIAQVLSEKLEKDYQMIRETDRKEPVFIASNTTTMKTPETSNSNEFINRENNNPNQTIKRKSKEIKKTFRSKDSSVEKTSEEPQVLCEYKYASEKKEVIEVLGKVIKKSLEGHGLNQSFINEISINTVIEHKTTVVIENTSISGDIETKTLWDVLKECIADTRTDKNDRRNIATSIASYPKRLKPVPIIIHAILAHYNSYQARVGCLVICGFDLQLNENAFSVYTIFFSIEKLLLRRTLISFDVLNMLNKCISLKSLSVYMGSVIKSNANINLSLPLHLEELNLGCISRHYANLILCSAAMCQLLREISISSIDFMDTDRLNGLKHINNVRSFTLRDIVFSVCPDFSFLKRMSALQELNMNKIFYSYTNEFKLKDIYEIKETLRYLSTEAALVDSYVLEGNNIVKENRTIGMHISPTTIRVDAKLYIDLGLNRMLPTMNQVYTVCIVFVKEVYCFLMDPVELEFSIDSTLCYLDISAKTATFASQTLLRQIQQIEPPFLYMQSIQHIYLMNFLKELSQNSIISVLSDRILNYTQNNKIKTLYISAPLTQLTMDIYRIVMFNDRMPDLKELCLFNVLFIPTSTSPRNENQKKALTAYSTLIHAAPPLMFNCKLMKSGDILIIMDSSTDGRTFTSMSRSF
ncbi:uncharacterized protein NEPG_00638 [Nematocida parisii ERTm1]|uniref:Uncharacterized protein n=1 Tax=Nematocida parisii (strain ERTm3) TaxID=935791 RepID=I3ED91_NEMP3|nr:uncharacterized protein NEPG_00638 [Nematocida parisii ERTm1]EIJ87188.1 hypothetical protein NEQG_02523 [Nematocida parisii ERTm3]KAI5126576.1 hypothetical protein NEPAR08_0495 [Nematocida parisii]EIJ95113.1 hypothetical protein NEPG_00638 [Nematocida parisii ERTm1]KAI5129397.1 hypothetical protein NEPAR03_1655 [Nematocida parisii]KAI5142210.1 hypothetical protein NEPAR04_1456 [Nematocida parisii]|eukprot:XP_013058469.1 hypothetical protein NEPG_00638 [Nematocida parisii ERTm1]